MKIAFDAKRAFENSSGLGNYSRFVIDGLSANFPDDDFCLYAPRDNDNPALATIRARENVASVFPNGVDKIFSSAWRSFGIVKDLQRADIQLFHGLSNELPLGLRRVKIRSVVTIHDLIFLRFPQFYKPIDRAIYRAKFRYACQNADKIVAVSECTKRDIVEFFGINPDKIAVVYQGCDKSFSAPVSEEKIAEVRQKYNLPETFILNVGTIEERKNLLLAAKSLPLLPPEIQLVAVGRERQHAQKVRAFAAAHGLTLRLHILQGVPLADLPAIYRAAAVFAYPSRFEGFGIPILEALCAGTPVVAATGSCLEEAGGKHSIYVSPDDEKSFAQAVLAFIKNPDLRRETIAAGKAYTQRFAPQKLAQQMRDLYAEVVGIIK